MSGSFNLETGRGGGAVTPGTAYAEARALWVGTAGDVNVRFPDGGSNVYHNVSGLLPVASVEVLSASTTASQISTIL